MSLEMFQPQKSNKFQALYPTSMDIKLEHAFMFFPEKYSINHLINSIQFMCAAPIHNKCHEKDFHKKKREGNTIYKQKFEVRSNIYSLLKRLWLRFTSRCSGGLMLTFGFTSGLMLIFLFKSVDGIFYTFNFYL